MPVYRITVGLNYYIYGASETLWTRQASPSSSRDLVEGLLRRRAALLPAAANFVGVRVAEEGARRHSTLLLPGVQVYPPTETHITVPATGTLPAALGVGAPDQFRAVMQWRVNLTGNRQSTRYLSCVPDTILAGEPASLQLAREPKWSDRWDDYRDALKAEGWQIRAQLGADVHPELPIRKLVIQTSAPSLLGIVVSEALVFPTTGRQLIHIRGMRRRNRGGISLNGKFFVDSVNTSLAAPDIIYWLQGVTGQATTDWKIMGSVQVVEYGFQPIQSAVAVRAGVHKRGRPMLLPRGRRLSRLTLDP